MSHPLTNFPLSPARKLLLSLTNHVEYLVSLEFRVRVGSNNQRYSHALRKSGTYTALDFAPPPRFKNESGTGSDAGSIRSNRTGISALQAHNIRSGAYRVSRLPAETVGTRDDFSSNLKPQWEMRT